MGRSITKKIKNHMSIIEAVALSQDREYIIDFFFNLKYPNGYTCTECQCTEFSYIKTRSIYQCKVCAKQSTIKSNTILQDSKLSLSTWFLAMYILINGQNTKVSSIDLAGSIGVSQKCANLIIRKLSLVMHEINLNHLLVGSIQIDEAYIGGKNEQSKAGKGTCKQSFICGVSLLNGNPQYAKFIINHGNVSSSSVFKSIIMSMVEKGSTLKSDSSTSFNGCKGAYIVDNKIVSHKTDNPLNTEHLKWVDIAISNIKSFIQGTYHGIAKQDLILYMASFEWRFNRRHIKTIKKIKELISGCILHAPIKMCEIRNHIDNNLSTASWL